MNKSLLKFITDFGPLLVFFTVYYKSGNNLSVAIPPLIITTLIAVAIVYFIDKKIPYVPLIGGIIISLFGGLTLLMGKSTKILCSLCLFKISSNSAILLHHAKFILKTQSFGNLTL